MDFISIVKLTMSIRYMHVYVTQYQGIDTSELVSVLTSAGWFIRIIAPHSFQNWDLVAKMQGWESETGESKGTILKRGIAQKKLFWNSCHIK